MFAIAIAIAIAIALEGAVDLAPKAGRLVPCESSWSRRASGDEMAESLSISTVVPGKTLLNYVSSSRAFGNKR